MPVPQFDTNFSKLTDGDLFQKTISFAETVKDHPAFQNLQEHVPGYDRFMTLADMLRNASEAARYGDKLKAEERDKIREEILRSFTFAGQHVIMVAAHRNDPTLLNIGLEQRQRVYRTAQHSLPGPPAKLFVKNGSPGVVVAMVNRDREMASVELQITENTGNDSSWKTVDKYYTCKMEVRGLEPVKRYYFRARYHNSVGVGPWSPVVNLVVV